ncbi:Acyl-lipid (8-3)-desaturase [Pseudolycoriella hygida]|uniref:Acyl-lipid (8-3)-desaturase n=1 Tax=Pseudolycoriella hygida TaxID=35572 RepID=A0A9Q0MPW3_9DIPT|nr:Acyl-lipid (8-3)-desaturase [Pseudolycoriella hygida]
MINITKGVSVSVKKEFQFEFKTRFNTSQKMDYRKEILFDGDFYDVTDFISKHPGGTVIEYYTEKGEDSTLVIQQLHKRSKETVKVMMSALKRRPASDSEIGLNTAVLQRNRNLTEDFTKLHLELEREGYFEPSSVQAILRCMETLFLFGIGYFAFKSENATFTFIGILLISVGSTRCGYLMHELGHYSYTGNCKIDKILHSIFNGVGVGLSATRWRRTHNRHHAMPQRLNHDVDLDTMPILAFNAKVVKNSKDGKGFMVQNQAFLFLIDLFLVGFVWKFFLDPKFVLKRKVYLDMGCMFGHYCILYHMGFWHWLFTTWFTSLFLLGHFYLSHTFLPVTTEHKHFVEYSFLHTADVEHAPWCDWIMGYLNYQIEHHLFPTIPNFRLPYIKHRVKALAEKHNLPYIQHSYLEAWRKMFTNLYQYSFAAFYLQDSLILIIRNLLPSKYDDSNLMLEMFCFLKRAVVILHLMSSH